MGREHRSSAFGTPQNSPEALLHWAVSDLYPLEQNCHHKYRTFVSSVNHSSDLNLGGVLGPSQVCS